MKCRTFILFLLLFAFLAESFNSNAQMRDTISQGKDTVHKKRDTIKKSNRDTSINKNILSQKPVKKDSLKISTIREIEITSALLNKSENVPAKDSEISAGLLNKPDSSPLPNLKVQYPPGFSLANTNKITDRVLAENRFINLKDKGIYFLQEIRTFNGKEFTFYILCILLFILAIFRTFYPMYFNNLFRIFFNTSLRQTQLTDQLSQAKFPSFVLNIFFTLSGGIYIWLLLKHFNKVQTIHSHTLLLICVISVAAIYLIKFLILKFTGWLAGIKSTVDNYIFVIFLVNKIMGVLLIPFLILLAFSINVWIPSIAVISGLFIGLLFLSRYAKSYGALEKKLNINSLHLLIFVIGAEIIPLLIFYKVAIDYLV